MGKIGDFGTTSFLVRKRFKDFFINFFSWINDKIHFIKQHQKTSNVIVTFSNAGERVVFNVKNNLENWKERVDSDHGFSIESEDS